MSLFSGTLMGIALIAGADADLQRFDIAAFKPTQAEISRLGTARTPVGADRTGNADGTIPPWTGGIRAPIDSYRPGEHHPDPYAGEIPLVVIDVSNAADFADKLTPGQRAMFATYDTYRMPIYPTHRSAAFPQHVYDATLRNAESASLTRDGEGVLGVAEGFPFPVPKTGKQLMWNHRLKYRGPALCRYNNQVAPTAKGDFTPIVMEEDSYGSYWQRGRSPEDVDSTLLYFRQMVKSPARLAGQGLLVHETLNQAAQGRQAWQYEPGARRVRRAPTIAYDTPGTASDGLRTTDMQDMFNGAMDRYDWRIVGKREIYVPYNSYRAHAGGLGYDDLVMVGHLNPEHMRYELHRVWVLEANLREGEKHIHPKRVYYLDEDSYQILLIDHYDADSNLWRFSEAHSINYYEVPTFWSTIEVHHDLEKRRYVASGLDNNSPAYDFQIATLDESDFVPQALRMLGRR